MSLRKTNQTKYISFALDLFQGGMDSDASPYTVPVGSATLGENVEFYRDNTIRARRGWAKLADANKMGMFLTHRINGQVLQVFRWNNNLMKLSNGTSSQLGTLYGGQHTFLRVLNGVLVVQSEGITLLDSDGFNTAAVKTPETLSAVPSVGGKLQEGKYEYFYTYLLRGGETSEQSPTLTVTVPDSDYKVTLTLPAPETHPKLYRKRIYRKDPTGGVALLIAELGPYETVLVDDGLAQSANTPMQGVRAMPGGHLALVQNRRLFTVDGDTLNYSYPGSYAYSNVFWTEKVNLPTGEPIRAICPLGQGVIFFGLETATFMNGVPAEGGTFAPIPVPDGCVGSQAWTTAEDGTLFYLGKSGVYAMTGVQAQRISDPLNDIFRNLSVGEMENATLLFDQQERRLLVSLPNQILAYYFQTRAWTVWTLKGTELDWFEGRIYLHIDGKFGVLGEAPTDNGQPIQGKFVSGVHGLDDATVHKIFRRFGLQVSAAQGDSVDLYVRSLDWEADYTGLPGRAEKGSTWGDAIWGVATWAGNTDTTQTVSLPDRIQGRYIQFTITFKTSDAGRFILMGPVVVEYRPQYRYGRK